MSEDNLYGLSDDLFDQIEKEIAHAEIESENVEQFLDSCFPDASGEMKARIALFSEKFAELFLNDDEEDLVE
jgi:hypothetical protein